MLKTKRVPRKWANRSSRIKIVALAAPAAASRGGKIATWRDPRYDARLKSPTYRPLSARRVRLPVCCEPEPLALTKSQSSASRGPTAAAASAPSLPRRTFWRWSSGDRSPCCGFLVFVYRNSRWQQTLRPLSAPRPRGPHDVAGFDDVNEPLGNQSTPSRGTTCVVSSLDPRVRVSHDAARTTFSPAGLITELPQRPLGPTGRRAVCRWRRSRCVATVDKKSRAHGFRRGKSHHQRKDDSPPASGAR